MVALEEHGADAKRKLFKKFVEVVNLETSSYCNRVCTYCPVSIYDRKNQILMTEVLFQSIIEDLAEIDYAKGISLNLYNEPLADSTFIDKVRFIRNRLPNCRIHTNSNGDYIHDQRILKDLSESGLSSIKITLHIPPKAKVYTEKMRVENLRKFAQKLDIVDYEQEGNFVYRFNVGDLPVFLQAPDWLNSGNSRAGEVEFLNSVDVRTQPCVKPFREFTIYHDGFVTPCCEVYHDESFRKHGVGAVTANGDSIFDVYNSVKLQRWRKSLFDYSPKSGICATCGDSDLANYHEDNDLRQNLLESMSTPSKDIE